MDDAFVGRNFIGDRGFQGQPIYMAETERYAPAEFWLQDLR